MSRRPKKRSAGQAFDDNEDGPSGAADGDTVTQDAAQAQAQAAVDRVGPAEDDRLAPGDESVHSPPKKRRVALAVSGSIDRLEVVNFKSYDGEHVLGPFRSLQAVIGPNGSGTWQLAARPAWHVCGPRSDRLVDSTGRQSGANARR